MSALYSKHTLAICPFKKAQDSAHLFLLLSASWKKRAISVPLSKRQPFYLIFRSHKGISVPPINSIHGLTGEQWHGHPALDRYSTFCSLKCMNSVRSHVQTHTEPIKKEHPKNKMSFKEQKMWLGFKSERLYFSVMRQMLNNSWNNMFTSVGKYRLHTI